MVTPSKLEVNKNSESPRPPFAKVPRVAQVYIVLFAALGAITVVSSLFSVNLTWEYFARIVLFAFGLTLADLFPVYTIPRKAYVSLDTAIHFASILLFGPAFTVLATLCGATAGEILNKRLWYRGVFNVSQFVFKVAIVGILYETLAGGAGFFLSEANDLIALIIAGGLYYLLDNSLVPMAIALSEGSPVISVWRIALRVMSLHSVSMIPLGAILAVLWQADPLAVVLAIAPIFVVRFSMSQVQLLREQTGKALLAFADAIDARDASTFQHSQRVAQYSEMIAQQLKIPYDDIEVLVTSARIHDIGKIGMSNELLNKPGIFTPEERIQFQNHVTIGDGLVAKFPAFGIGREVILYHHERYDGKGYPHNLKGEDIPIGARILAAADAFDAMTSDRPYRKAMTKEVALAKLQENAGTQFDPQVVEAFVTALKERGMLEVREAEEAPAVPLAQPEPHLPREPQPELEGSLPRVAGR